MTKLVVLDGNSLVAFAKPLREELGPDYEVINHAIAGQTTIDMFQNTADIAQYANRPDKVLVSWEIRNDMTFYPGVTPKLGVDRYEIYNKKVKNQLGYAKTIAMTTIPSGAGFANGWQVAAFNQVNNQLVNRWQNFADGLVDLRSYGELNAPFDLKYFMIDRIHLTPAAQKIVAKAVAQKVREVLP